MTTNTPYSADVTSKILNSSIDKWGEDLQLIIAMEECGELTRAISKVLRGKEGAIANVIEEVADVQIMIEQITFVLERRGLSNARECIEEQRQQKLRRTVERLVK